MNRTDQYAVDLIQAVQSCDTDVLRGAIQKIEAEAEWEWMETYTAPGRGGSAEIPRKVNYIDSPFGPMGLTALHIAAKGYAAHTQEYGQVFNEMIRLLIEAGADPCLAFGQKRAMRCVAGIEVPVMVDMGRTIAEECKGHIAPALLEAYAALPSDNYAYGNDPGETRRMNAYEQEQKMKIAA